MTTAKEIFNYINGMTNQSFYKNVDNQSIADDKLNDVVKSLNENSLAYKIATSGAKNFTDKQLWVISFELLNNLQFTSKVAEFNSELIAIQNRKATNKVNNKALKARATAERQEKLAKLRAELGYN
jgi:hypothetical protein